MTNVQLQVVVVGAGIAGLSTAIALRRAGHVVTILERYPSKSEAGTAITIPPNATKILARWEFDFRRARTNQFAGMHVYTVEGDALQDNSHVDFDDMADRYGAPYLISHRADMHGELKRLATSASGARGPAAVLRENVSASSYDAGAGAVTLHDHASDTTSTICADLVVAADGLHSKAPDALGSPSPPYDSTTVVNRFFIPTASVHADPSTAPLLARGPGHGEMYVAADRTRWLFRYPCRDNALQTFCVYRTLPADQALSPAAPRPQSTQADLVSAAAGFPAPLLAACNDATDVLPLWVCAERAPLARYAAGRLAAVGDAAHAMFPHLGQGGAMAVEDAAGLGAVLEGLSGEEGEVEARLAVWEQVRRPRATAAQCMSRMKHWERDGDEGARILRQAVEENAVLREGDGLPKGGAEMYRWLYSYDVVEECEKRRDALRNYN